ncbi:hypothetical protein [Nocardioides sp. SYSU D00038]|uniref:hypothetical protein n=1 Tax=Nocardioides sp. SYSU D00038 TaxID=2812554 RepID=UPI00196711A3|nr:hypothetical protein [Nocardioides sp. SYSU D00038]
MRTTTIAALATTALLALPAAASAQTITMDDPKGDQVRTGFGGDVDRVEVEHLKTRVVVSVVPEKDDAADYWVVHVDTDARNPGPEYVLGASVEVEPRLTVSKVDTWHDPDATRTCSLRSFRYTDTGVARFSVPRRCLRPAGDQGPKHVRINVEARNDYPDRKPVDVVPAHHAFGKRWVAVG